MPGTGLDVEEEAAGGVGDFGSELAGEAKADVILGQQNLPAFLVVPRLMLPEPEDFGCSEAGKGGVGDHLDECGASAGLFFDLGALSGGALVVPEERGAEDFAGGIEEDRTVHLAGEADGADGGGFSPGFSEHGASGAGGGLIPLLGTLLGPARFGGQECVGGFGGGKNFARIGKQECFRAGRTDVDAKEGHGNSCVREGTGIKTSNGAGVKGFNEKDPQVRRGAARNAAHRFAAIGFGGKKACAEVQRTSAHVLDLRDLKHSPGSPILREFLLGIGEGGLGRVDGGLKRL